MPFARWADKAENPKDVAFIGGKEFREGDSVYGTWVNSDGRTYYGEGKIIRNEITGLWVQAQPDGGITDIKRFVFLNRQTPNPKTHHNELD